MNQAAHSGFLRRHLVDEPFTRTGFDAVALSALKSGTPVTGSAAAPLVDPVAGCASAPSHAPLPKEALMGALRAAITKIEGHGICDAPACQQDAPAWRLGCSTLDRLLPQGLDMGGVHEVKPVARAAPHGNSASAGDWMTGFGFAPNSR